MRCGSFWHLPQFGNRFFLKRWSQTALIGQMDRAEERLHVRIVNHANASGFSRRPAETISPVVSAHATAAAGGSHAGATAAFTAASSSRTAGAAVGPHQERTTLRIDQEKPSSLGELTLSSSIDSSPGRTVARTKTFGAFPPRPPSLRLNHPSRFRRRLLRTDCSDPLNRKGRSSHLCRPYG